VLLCRDEPLEKTTDELVTKLTYCQMKLKVTLFIIICITFNNNVSAPKVEWVKFSQEVVKSEDRFLRACPLLKRKM
jgi:hypothetical protein